MRHPIMPQRKSMGVKVCTEEDLSRTPQLWERGSAMLNVMGLDILCPIDNDLTFKGSFTTMDAQVMGLSITTCTPENKLSEGDCASPSEIKKFVSHTLVMEFPMKDIIDFEIRGDGKLPIF